VIFGEDHGDELRDRDEKIAKLTKALEFYADPENWKDVETGIGMLSGPAIDYGYTAREALK